MEHKQTSWRLLRPWIPIGGFHSRCFFSSWRRWVIIPTLQGEWTCREDTLWGQKSDSLASLFSPSICQFQVEYTWVSSFVVLTLWGLQRNCEDWTWFSWLNLWESSSSGYATWPSRNTQRRLIFQPRYISDKIIDKTMTFHASLGDNWQVISLLVQVIMLYMLQKNQSWVFR